MQFGLMVRTALVAVLGFCSTQALAEAGEAEVNAHFEQLSASSGGAFSVEAITATSVDNIFQVQLSGGDLVHASPSADGEYLLVGSLMQLKDGQLVNVTELEREQAMVAARAGLLGQLKAADAIVFAPEGEVKGTINVFTDISCGFCRKLHQEVPELNAMGIEVRYLAFPRGGQRSSTYGAMQAIWCSDDRQQAMTRAKQGEGIPSGSCSSKSVDEQYRLGGLMGVSGTPAIFLEDGRLIPGYRDAQTLAKILGVE